MSKKIKEMRRSLDRRMGRLEEKKDSIARDRRGLRELKADAILNKKAQVIIHEASKDTQERLKLRLSDVVTMGMASVFDNPYELGVDFKISRGRVEAFLSFVRDGHVIKDPVNGAGLGAVDVAAANLRMTAWALSSPRPRNTIIMDEPFKHLKGREYPAKAADMLREVSAKLGLQIIMISHDPELIDGADHVVRVKQNRSTGVSEIIST